MSALVSRRQAVACSGAVLVAHVGLAHEVIGTVVYPYGPGVFGGPVGWQAAGLAGQFGWRVLCGLRLERRPSPGYVGGWKIADRGDRWIRSEAASWFMTAHIVVQVDDGQLSVATFVRYDRPIAALVWPPLSAGHRLAMPGLLRKTVRAMRIAVERGT